MPKGVQDRIICNVSCCVAAFPYEEFLSKLQEVKEKREARYCVFDLDYTQKSTGAHQNKLVFIYW